MDRNGSKCEGFICDGNGTVKRSYRGKKDSAKLLPIMITLLTLNHDLLRVVAKDWICPQRGFQSVYAS